MTTFFVPQKMPRPMEPGFFMLSVGLLGGAI
jgi:hypothetical protein